MSLQHEVHSALKQDFKNHSVLGRVLFGFAFALLGLLSILQSGSLSSYAPQYVPFATFLIIVIGILFLVSGLGIIANKEVKRACYAIIGVHVVFLLLLHLPSSDFISIAQDVAYIGAALLIANLSH